jgi:hypothetical protein
LRAESHHQSLTRRSNYLSGIMAPCSDQETKTTPSRSMRAMRNLAEDAGWQLSRLWSAHIMVGIIHQLCRCSTNRTDLTGVRRRRRG